MEKVKERFAKALRSSKGLGYYSVYKRYESIVDSKKLDINKLKENIISYYNKKR
jgi:hypothetical protein